MKDLVEVIAKSLVDHPEEVVVKAASSKCDKKVVVEILQ